MMKPTGRRATPKTFRAGATNRRARTARATGRRGLHDLLEVYEGISGFNANTLGLSEYKTTYGEVAEAGIQILSDKFRQHGAPAKFPTGARSFYDLGCGIGRVVVGIAMLNPEIQGKGIEIVPDRVRNAQQAMERIRHKQVATRVKVAQGSFLDPVVNLRDACWIFVSNLCFDSETQKSIADKLVAECQKGAIVISSREFPFAEKEFQLIETGLNVPMTWSASSTCAVYRRVL
jgi:SAM-dependent methyltransferase